jgi:hypothetical protein
MATRRTIDSLVEEFASMRGVSNDNAIRIALMEAIAREEEPELEPEVWPVAKEIMMRRVWVAYMDGQDSGSSNVFNDIASACFVLTPILILGLFSRGVREGCVGLVIIVGVVSLYYYHRSMEKSKEERSKGRVTINKDIVEMKNKLPDGLEFLADGPTYMDVLLSSFEQERDSAQVTR